MNWRCATFALLLPAGASAARASLIVTAGDHPLAPDTPNQQVLIYVSGDQQVQAVQVQCQIADGGLLGGGTVSGPTISELDVIAGTIFADNNIGQNPELTGRITPWLASRGTITESGSVLANGLLATLTIDTSGFTAGSWDLFLADTANRDTVFGNIVPEIINGTIYISSDTAPEPATALLLAAGAALLLRRRQFVVPPFGGS